MQEENNPYTTPEASIEIEKEVLVMGPKGLSGWLILPIFHLFFGLYLKVVGIDKILRLMTSEKWLALTDVYSLSYHYMWQSIFIFELVGYILLIIFSLFYMYSYFKKNRAPQNYLSLGILLKYYLL